MTHITKWAIVVIIGLVQLKAVAMRTPYICTIVIKSIPQKTAKGALAIPFVALLASLIHSATHQTVHPGTPCIDV